jgi:cobalt-zinc-cadmium efflux system outer membrane protein
VPKRLVGVLATTLAFSGPAHGGAPETAAPLTFRAALDLAIANNLDLQAARRGRAVREAEVRAAGQHPNPDLSFETTRDTPHQTLSLDIPFEPWKRSHRIDLAREQLRLADVDEKTALQALRRRVRTAFYGLLAAEESAGLARTMQDVAERLRQAAQARFDEGAAPRLDVMQAELGVARARADLELARSARGAAQADLNALLNRPPSEGLTLAGDLAEAPPLPLVDRANAVAAASNADLLAAEREAAIENRRLSLLKAERFPTPIFSLGAVFNAPGEFDVGGRAGLSLAVPVFSRNQGEIAGSLARIDQVRIHRDALRRSIEARVFAALGRAEAQRAQVEAYRQTVLPTATTIESLAEEGYRLGRSSVLAVLDAQRSLRDVKIEYLQALLAQQSALADLEDVLGGPID